MKQLLQIILDLFNITGVHMFDQSGFHFIGIFRFQMVPLVFPDRVVDLALIGALAAQLQIILALGNGRQDGIVEQLGELRNLPRRIGGSIGQHVPAGLIAEILQVVQITKTAQHAFADTAHGDRTRDEAAIQPAFIEKGDSNIGHAGLTEEYIGFAQT